MSSPLHEREIPLLKTFWQGSWFFRICW